MSSNDTKIKIEPEVSSCNKDVIKRKRVINVLVLGLFVVLSLQLFTTSLTSNRGTVELLLVGYLFLYFVATISFSYSLVMKLVSSLIKLDASKIVGDSIVCKLMLSLYKTLGKFSSMSKYDFYKLLIVDLFLSSVGYMGITLCTSILN